VQTSSGPGVPLFDYKQERGSLVRYWAAHGVNNLRKYWGLKNMKSIDGLPTYFAPDSMAPHELATRGGRRRPNMESLRQ